MALVGGRYRGDVCLRVRMGPSPHQFMFTFPPFHWTLGILTSNSRVMYAFSRDGGIPGSSFCIKSTIDAVHRLVLPSCESEALKTFCLHSY